MRKAVLAAFLGALLCSPARADDWTPIPVPGVWEDADKALAEYDGFAWYRCSVQVPEAWKDEDVTLIVERIDNAHEAWVNGTRVGGGGAFPPNYQNGLDHRGRYRLDAKSLRPGQRNLVAIRVYDRDGRGGFKGAAPMLVAARDALLLKGDWQFRTGDDLAWARPGDGLPAEKFSTLVPVTDLSPQAAGDGPGPLSPAEGLRSLKVPDDLEVEQVLAEPLVAQPVFLTFDERGRMWVVQYRQYPHPAGLTMVNRDQYWRAVYDKVPLPPPLGDRGRDKITIHEDTDGDGRFDRHKTFVDGLNIATACVPGREGVWVLNPPYLLFYPDLNRDDIPDADPVVHLEGFGLEDTHSVANSLCWGPDGWLYGAQGSTVTGNVRRPGDKATVRSQGQLIWRYHPRLAKYEVFAEGGGNAFGVEIDPRGRIFSGHNGGDTRGFHYHQGAYLQKGFSKHGPLSNPFAFGYFPAMPHHTVPRFTHTFVIYDGTALPEQYRGKLFGVAPLLNHVVFSEILPEGSTFRTRDLGLAIESPDPWFRPVDVKIGPEGALYVADWYDGQANHYRNHEGQIDISNGRIYRLRAKGSRPRQPVDLAALTSDQLVDRLAAATEPWQRRTALRVLGDRNDTSAIARLRGLLDSSSGETALSALWGLQLCGGFTDEIASRAFGHADPFVRLWAVRLVGDQHRSSPLSSRMADLAQRETNVEVRAQLACTARRLPAAEAFAILTSLWTHTEDARDSRLPLLTWWALESKCEDQQAVLDLFADSSVWGLPIVAEHILPRAMRRYAAAGSRRDLTQCAKLLEAAPNPASAVALIRGFEEAFQGRPMGRLPEELLAALSQHGGSALLGVRLNRPQAVQDALKTIADPQADRLRRIEYIQVLGDVRPAPALASLFAVFRQESARKIDPAGRDAELLSALVSSLSGWNDPQVAETILHAYVQLPPDSQALALSVLASRAEWTRRLLASVDSGRLPPASVPIDIVRRMTVHRGDDIAALVQKHWGSIDGATTEAMQQQIERLNQVAAAASGSPYAGKKLFAASCGKCHRLHGQGGQIGPDLTTYKRDALDSILLSVVNPSAEIREGFETWLAADKDGRVITGFLVDQDPKTVSLRNPEGQTVTLSRDELDEFQQQRKSLMPEGLLRDFQDQQIRDLLAYLRSTQPLND